MRALTEHASLQMRIVQRDREVAIDSARGAIEAAHAIGDRAPRLLAPIESRAVDAGVELGSEGVSPSA